LRAEGVKERPMRWVCGVFFALGLITPAAAADYDLPPPSGPAPNFDVLRGPQTVGPATFTRWSGFYGGGQVGLGNGFANFSTATQSLITFALRDTLLEESIAPSSWPVLGSANARTISYGGFVGYNTQWEDLILGMEANFNRASFTLRAPTSPIARTGSDSAGNAYIVDLNGSGSLVGEDFATLRLRSGWVVGNFLPYAFVGLALGIANTSILTTVSGEEYTSGTVGTCSSSAPCFPFNYTNGLTANNTVLYGFTVGGGVDVALTSNIFLRAEIEWDQFNPPPGFLATIVTGRVGGGIKF
jgi:outer membrane immunogenic protein